MFIFYRFNKCVAILQTANRKLLSTIALWFLPMLAMADTNVLDFNFIDNKLENGFGKWSYVDKGSNPCGVYNGHNTSKLCSDDNYRFYLYYNGYNTHHMGWLRYGFIDSDSKFSITGSSLKVTLTGGAFPDDNGEVVYLGKPIYSKSDLTSEDDYGVSSDQVISAGGASLYFKGPTKTSNFPKLQEKNRLTLWVLWPKAKDFLSTYQLSSSLKRPNTTFSLYPFINIGDGGHYYHNISNIPMGGWTKIQFDAHPQHHNGGSKNEYSAFSVGGYEYPGDGIEYFNNISTLSFVAGFHNSNKGFPASIYIDDISSHLKLYENDETINNLAVGYDQENRIFDISFADKYRCLQDCNAKYLIKYSFSPITQSNFAQAYTPEEVINFNREHSNDQGTIIKPNSGYNNIWAALRIQTKHLPLLSNGATVYFAIKDISERTNINQEAIDFAEQVIPNVGNVKTIDLIKTIDYKIHIIDYPLTIESNHLKTAIAGKYYSDKLQLSGGKPPYQVSALSTLPEGITVNNEGIVSGTPITVGKQSFDIKLKDSNNDEYLTSIELEIKDQSEFIITSCESIVDFNASTYGDVISSPKFNSVISDKYSGNALIGKTIITGQNGGYNFQGVIGDSVTEYNQGDIIRSVWFNNSDEAISFTPYISFDDPDRRISGATGTWHQMEKVRIESKQWGISNFVFDAKQAVTVVNINANFNNHKTLILDKIEFISTHLPAENECEIPYSLAESLKAPLLLKTTELEPAITNYFYSTNIEATGGTPPYNVITYDKLPDGLTLDTHGLLSGETNSLGEYNLDIELSDADHNSTNHTFSLKVLTEADLNETQCTELVDFAGGVEGSDLISSANFSQIISDKYTRNEGVGKTIVIGENGGYNFQGISGTGLEFNEGDVIRSVWFNNTDAPITFTPKISFDDIDRRDSGASGNWESMQTTTIKPYNWGISNFNVPSAWAGYQKLININVNYNHQKMIMLDKIEYVSPNLLKEQICHMPFPKNKL